jgi:diketogulonate reductase-like aldo/keto reductase
LQAKEIRRQLKYVSSRVSLIQVLLKWAQQKGAVPVTTSSQPQRQKEQLKFNEPVWTLSDDEMREIDVAGSKLHYRKFWYLVKNPQWDDEVEQSKL